MKCIFKIFKLVIISVCIRAILGNTTLVNALNITNTSNTRFYTKHIVLNVRLFFDAAPFLCITSKSEETLNALLELLNNGRKSVSINNLSKKLLNNCVKVFILESNNNTIKDCESITDSSQTTVVYVIEDSITAGLQHSLEACLSEAKSPEVFALSLSDSSLLQLSPVYPRPRHFIRTSVTQVLQRRGNKSNKLDLQGSALTVGVITYVPYFLDGKSNRSKGHDGLYVQLVKEMSRQFNFTYTFFVRSSMGIALSNGTWIKGLGQDIQEGKIDILAYPTWHIPAGYNLLDFGPALNKVKKAFLVMRPERIDFQWQDILRTFQPEVWFAIFGSFVLTVVVYWAGLNYSSRPYTESWSGCILTLFGYFTSSTSHSQVDEGNTRFSLTGWSVFSLLITSCLSTGIVTRLTIPLYSPRINTVEQLVKSQYSWSTQFYASFKSNPSLKESMFDMKNHWIQQLEKRYVYMDPEEVARTLGTDKKMVFVVQTDGLDYVSLTTIGLDGHINLKKYRVATESFTEAYVSFGVKKCSFLLEPLNKFTLLVLQAGLMTHWKEEVISRWPQYDTRHLLIEQDIPTFREPQGLPLNKMQPVFLLLLFGLSLASIVFILEICCKRG